MAAICTEVRASFTGRFSDDPACIFVQAGCINFRSNLAIFAQAFGCKKGDAIVREQACKIW